MATTRKNSGWHRLMKKPAARYTVKTLSALGKCLLTIILIGVITVTLVGCIMMVYIVTNFKDEGGIPDLDTLSATATTTIETLNPETGEWEVFQQLKGTNSIWKDLDDIPLNMQRAVIAIEDERFETHYGVDWKRTISAFANLIFHFNSVEYGGSTITQQLIKQTTQDDDHSIERKITEILRAVELEKNHATKDEILEAYLNILPLSDNMVGVGAGAQYFFGKDVEDLTIAECAVIASITQNPSRYNPYTHPANNRQRQLLVLQKMYDLDYITEEEYRQAVGEELHFKNGLKRVAVQDYYVDLLIEDVIQDLMDTKGYTYQYAQNLVFHGGLTIRSAEIPSQQEAVEKIYATESNFPKVIEGDEENPQGAIFIMDYSGRVVATVGGRGEKTADRVLNRSTQSKRQPGSAIKPLSVYAPAVKMNVVHYSSMWRDAYIVLKDGTKWPVNYRSKLSDNGDKLINYAVQESLNTIPVRLVQEMTPAVCFDFCTSVFKLSTLVKSQSTDAGIVTDMDLSPLALGGLTNGVYAREMAAAYAVFGSGGVYNEPFTYYEVSRGQGAQKEVLLTDGNQVGVPVLDEGSAYVMNRLLQQVVERGTAQGEIGNKWKDWEVFGKTGTTTDNKDVYFCGGTAYYVGASWFGYDHNKALNSSQTPYARRLWNLSMKALHADLQPKTFDKKGETQELEYCTATGLLATDGCPNKDIGVYKKENTPGYCTAHGGTADTTTSAAAESGASSSATSSAVSATASTAGSTTAAAQTPAA